MDRDHARTFIKRMVDEEHEFIKSLEDYREQVESTEDWANVMKNFAPTIKGFYNARLEAWSRFYLGLDAQSYSQGHGVMHIAQKKDRSSMAATIPHSLYGELKYKMKVGTANKLTATGAPAAREIMERKLGGEGQVIESRGMGGKIGGEEEETFEKGRIQTVQLKDDGEPKTPPAPRAPSPEKPAPKDVEEKKPKKVVLSHQTKEVPADKDLAAILERRNRMYAEGK